MIWIKIADLPYYFKINWGGRDFVPHHLHWQVHFLLTSMNRKEWVQIEEPVSVLLWAPEYCFRSDLKKWSPFLEKNCFQSMNLFVKVMLLSSSPFLPFTIFRFSLWKRCWFPGLWEQIKITVSDLWKERWPVGNRTLILEAASSHCQSIIAIATLDFSKTYLVQFEVRVKWKKETQYPGFESLPASFRWSYPYWLRILSTIIGARDWPGFVNRAFVPNTMEERGELQR